MSISATTTLTTMKTGPMSNAAAKFLAGLPVLPIHELPTDCQTCNICQEDYLTAGDGCEHPISLPCKHVFGQSCIAQWISPDAAEPRNSCPMCRAHLFENEKPAEDTIETAFYRAATDFDYIGNSINTVNSINYRLSHRAAYAAPSSHPTAVEAFDAIDPTDAIDPVEDANHFLSNLREFAYDEWEFKTQLVNYHKATILLAHQIIPEFADQLLKDDEAGVMAALRTLNAMFRNQGDGEYKGGLLDAIHHATAETYNTMEEEREKEEKGYLDNMTILFAEMKERLGGDVEEIESWTDALALANLVEGVPAAPYHDRYLGEIAQYWRKTGGTGEARKYEEVWTFVAGRALRQE